MTDVKCRTAGSLTNLKVLNLLKIFRNMSICAAEINAVLKINVHNILE